MKFQLASIMLFMLTVVGHSSTTLFYDGFETDNLATVWAVAGTGLCYRDNTAPLCGGSYKLEFTSQRYVTNKTAISTVGYSNIRFNFYMAADSMDTGEYGQAQYSTDGGNTWIVVAEIRDPNDLNRFTAYNLTLPPAAENIANLMIRFRIYGNANNDYLKVDEVYVTGDSKPVDNTAKAITGFTFPQGISSIIDEAAKTIAVAVPFGTDVTVLIPTIAITGVSVSPASGVAHDFTTPAIYTVTAADSTTQTYTVTVTVSIDPDIAKVAADKAALTDSMIKGANTDLAHITVALTNPLPSSGSNGSEITWASDTPGVVSNDGQTVNRPAYGSGNATVILTAILRKGLVSDTKIFTLTVLEKTNSTTLFYDGFEVNNLTAIWTPGGTGNYGRNNAAPLCVGSYKLVCSNKRYVTNKTAISTVGYSNIRFNFYMAAESLEAGEYCQAQYSTDGGNSWDMVAEIRDPNDLNKFTPYNITLPPAAENIVNLKIRFRIYGSGNNDYLKVDEVYVTGDFKPVDNPPSVSAGANQNITLPTTTATLSGTATDADATPVAINIWTVKSSPPGATVTIDSPNSLTAGLSGLTLAGNYVFRLTSTDTAGNSGYAEVTITVKPLPVNQPPTVNAGADKSITLPSTTTTLLGTATDPDGTIASMLWTQAGGPKNVILGGQNTNTLSIGDLTIAGDYEFTLTATDNSGASNFDTAKVTVFPQPPPASGYPTFNNIPFAIGIAVDDLGEKFWMPDQSRNATNADYQTIINIGQAVGTRIMTAWVMCNLDRSNILAEAIYNKPAAPYNMSTLGTGWDNSAQVSPNDLVLMNLVKANNAYMEFGLHGVLHVHPNANNVYVNAEYAYITDKEYTSTSWGSIDMGNRAKCFRDLIRQYYTADEMPFPEAFVPPAHAYFYNNNDSQSTGALLSTYGVKFVNGDTSVATTLGPGGTDHGVIFINRAGGANYNWENTATQNATPWYGSWNSFDYPDYPTDDFGWVESHFPNWWGYDVNNRWITYLQGINNAPDRMLPRNTEACSSQWFYHRNAAVSGSNGTYSLTINPSMPDVVYTWNLLGTLTIKTPLNGLHVSSAFINNGAQVVGYYEDNHDYGYLIIANPSNPIGGLAKGTYILSATLGDTTMNTYVDMTLKTFNVYGFDASSTQATVSLKMYGTQDVKVKTLFIPTDVSSNNPNLTVNSWNYAEPYITINVTGRNMNGESGTLTIN